MVSLATKRWFGQRLPSLGNRFFLHKGRFLGMEELQRNFRAKFSGAGVGEILMERFGIFLESTRRSTMACLRMCIQTVERKGRNRGTGPANILVVLLVLLVNATAVFFLKIKTFVQAIL
jgi:hypothetical protein